jgi:hypothetical protein
MLTSANLMHKKQKYTHTSIPAPADTAGESEGCISYSLTVTSEKWTFLRRLFSSGSRIDVGFATGVHFGSTLLKRSQEVGLV